MTNQPQSSGSAIPGFAVLGCMLTGMAGLVFAFLHKDVLGLFAAALGFGVVVSVCFRK